MHINATATALPRVAVRSKAGRFEWDGGLQCQNAWQNRDLRPILPLKPTGTRRATELLSWLLLVSDRDAADGL